MNIFISLPQDDETKIYNPDPWDLFFIIDGYLFAVQTRNNVNNVVLKKYKESETSLLEVFKAFRDELENNDIQYIRVEGNIKRYKFLKKYFNAIQDKRIKDRNVFYVKIF